MKFDMGYPKRTGNDQEDLINLHSFVSEMSDRLNYLFGLIGRDEPKQENQEEQ